MNDPHQILLGELKAGVDDLKKGQDRLLAKVDALDARLRGVETKGAVNGLVAGGVVSVAIALIKSHLTGTP